MSQLSPIPVSLSRPWLLLMIFMVACGQDQAPKEYKQVTNYEICSYLDHGFLQSLEGKVDSTNLPYSLAEFEKQFGISKNVTGELFRQGVELGRQYANNTDDEIDILRETYRDACVAQFSNRGRPTVNKSDWVAVIGEENEYRNGDLRFELSSWSVNDRTRQQCEKFLESVKGDAVHAACITREQAEQGKYPWWAVPRVID